MRHALLALTALSLLAACQQVAPTAASHAATGLAAMSKAAPVDPALAAALARFSSQEGRKVTASQQPPANGHAKSTLAVPLDTKDRAMLLELYRLMPQPSDASRWPTGLLGRAADHLATLYHYGLPSAPAIGVAGMQAQLKPREYHGGDGKPIAYEAFLRADAYSIAGKYDTAGRLLQVDMDSWQAVP